MIVNTNPQTGGMGEVGVVSSPVYYASGLTQNPALLARGGAIFGGQLSYTPWLRALGIPDIYMGDFGIYGKIDNNNKHALGYRLRYFDLGALNPGGNLGQPPAFVNPYELTQGLRYAWAATDHLSVGVGLNHFTSQLVYASSGQLDPRPMRDISGDMGFVYHSGSDPFNWSVGGSVLNMGRKQAVLGDGIRNQFIPTQANLGVMMGIKDQFGENGIFTFETAYQVSKLLVPSEGGRSEKSAIGGIFSSFWDAPGGFSEELQEYVHQFGVEGRVQSGEVFMAAIRSGAFLEHANKGNRKYITLGSSIGLYGFRFDFAHLIPLQQNHPLQGTIRVALSFVTDFDQDGFGFMRN